MATEPDAQIIDRRTLTAMEAERLRQDRQWGGWDHDDRHDDNDWLAYVLKQIERASGLMGDSIPPEVSEMAPYYRARWQFEDAMVRIAALAVAAYESSRRKRGAP